MPRIIREGFALQRFEIFKPGKHVSAAGAELSFSDADLAAIVANYDPAVHEAPIVVGHPRDNGPAYGWVASIAFADGALAADPKQVDVDFAEMVKAGRFKKRSASFYAPGAKNHPLAGKDGHDAYYLRHVGFLGAAAPAVKGLKAVEFSDDAETVSFEEDWASKSTLARLFSNLRDWMLATHGQEKADAVLPKWEVEGLKDAARPPVEAATATPAFTEEARMTPQEIDALKARADKADQLAADLAKVNADFAEAKAKVEAADKAAALAKVKAAIEPHVAAGRVLPAEVESLAAFAATLDDGTATFDFAEGDKTEKVTARALFLGQLGKRPVAVDFAERAPAKGDKDEPVAVADAQKALLDQVSGKAPKAKK